MTTFCILTQSQRLFTTWKTQPEKLNPCHWHFDVFGEVHAENVQRAVVTAFVSGHYGLKLSEVCSGAPSLAVVLEELVC
ncbi:MAG: hypothetical protein DID91_2727704722 [Candidatus Nitrotoga sp. MKT]|nr:MAG: hypothetical protein DID91_2727704722 [Candidatus Nitrotoga sp. MKT]